MTMTDAALAHAIAAIERDVQDAAAALSRAGKLVAEARDYVGMQGSDDWLGPARAKFDERSAVERAALEREEDELALLRLAIQGAV